MHLGTWTSHSNICSFCQHFVQRCEPKPLVRKASTLIRRYPLSDTGARRDSVRPESLRISDAAFRQNNILNPTGPQHRFIDSVRERVAELKRAKDPTFDKSVGIDRSNQRHSWIIKNWFNRLDAATRSWEQPEVLWKETQLRKRLLKAWTEGRSYELDAELRFSLTGQLVNDGINDDEIMRQARFADASYPAEWYPLARISPRKIHLHIGPTNSGKTYHALQRLLSSGTGIYAGPLRLLAYEVYSRITHHGRNCHLITGDERIIAENDDNALLSCTVEMAPLSLQLDVAVIDEIQMLGDPERGWAWTNAVLGLRAAELHLCGEARSLPLVKALVASTGEELIVHEYTRLSPLEVAETGLGSSLANVQPGDCLVAFSRSKIHRLVHELTPMLSGKVAVIYGALPPEIRVEQARLFNDPDSGYDVIVASDAIGMGLNLNIQRLVFTAIRRWDGAAEERLPVAALQQIGGRAGRYRVAPSGPAAGSRLDVQNPDKSTPSSGQSQPAGLVTTLHDSQLPYVDSCMNRKPPPLKTAGIKLLDAQIQQYATYFPEGTPLSYILLRLREVTRTSRLYHTCVTRDDILTADAIASVAGLSNRDRLCFCASPVDPSNATQRAVVVELAKCVGAMSGGELLNLKQMPLDVLEKEPEASLPYLQELEILHKCLTLYLWLAFRFRAIFVNEALASHVRRMTEDQISKTLDLLASSRKTKTFKAPTYRDVIWEEEDGAENGDDIVTVEQPVAAIGKNEQPGLDALLGDLIHEPKRDEIKLDEHRSNES